MAEQQLNRPEVSRLAVELRDLGSAERVRSEAAFIEPDIADTAVDDANILAGRDMRTTMRSALEKVITVGKGPASEEPFSRHRPLRSNAAAAAAWRKSIELLALDAC